MVLSVPTGVPGGRFSGMRSLLSWMSEGAVPGSCAHSMRNMSSPVVETPEMMASPPAYWLSVRTMLQRGVSLLATRV